MPSNQNKMHKTIKMKHNQSANILCKAIDMSPMAILKKISATVCNHVYKYKTSANLHPEHYLHQYIALYTINYYKFFSRKILY